MAIKNERDKFAYARLHMDLLTHLTWFSATTRALWSVARAQTLASRLRCWSSASSHPWPSPPTRPAAHPQLRQSQCRRGQRGLQRACGRAAHHTGRSIWDRATWRRTALAEEKLMMKKRLQADWRCPRGVDLLRQQRQRKCPRPLLRLLLLRCR